MTNYGMAMIIEGREVSLPVLPAKLKVTSPGKNETTTVLELGEILRLRKKGLRTVAWDCFFPVHDAPYVTGQIRDPIEIVQAIQAARDTLTPIRLLITGTDLDINVRMGIETFDYEERSGELGDLYYSIKLSEWKDYSPRKIVLPPEPKKPAKAQEPKRAGAPKKTSKTHTVVRGDCLWAIAQKYYGKGSRYPEIYAANQSQIDARNRGTGNPKYTIYPGQVFTIP